MRDTGIIEAIHQTGVGTLSDILGPKIAANTLRQLGVQVF